MKKTIYFLSFALFSVLLMVSCNRGPGKKLKEAKEKVETVRSMAKSISKLEERSEEMQSVAEELQAIDPFTKDQFKEWMPDKLGDLERTSFEFTSTMGSNGSLKYKSTSDADDEDYEERSLEINIIDGAGEMGAAVFAAQSFFTGFMDEYDSEDEYKSEQMVERNGAKALETYYKQNNKTEIKTTIANRFIVTVNAYNMKPDEAWKLIDKLKVEKLK